jgi:hypothetical protein
VSGGDIPAADELDAGRPGLLNLVHCLFGTRSCRAAGRPGRKGRAVLIGFIPYLILLGLLSAIFGF